MITFFSEEGLLSLVTVAVFGGLVLYKQKNNHDKIGNKVAYSVTLLFLGEVYCFSCLSYFWGFSLFSLVCIISYIYLSGQEMLPVDQKAVLITAGAGARTGDGLGDLEVGQSLSLKAGPRRASVRGAVDCSSYCFCRGSPQSRFLGGGSGFGHALAKLLDKLGFIVFAGVLNERGPGAEELRRSSSERLTVLQMDVTKPAQVKEAYRRVLEKVQDTGLWAVVNNAGIIGYVGDGELTSMNVFRQCMEVNFFGAIEVTKTFLPLLRKAKGRLINVSSMAGATPFSYLCAYGSSKAALTMFSGILRQELSRWGVKVVLIQPGGFRTSIHGSPELWDALEKDLLENLQEDVKEDYGIGYIQALKNLLKAMSKYPITDLSPVLFDLLHAILSKHSFALYTPGKNSYLFLCISSFFPIWVSDALIKTIFNFKLVPKALQKPDPPNKKL
uniref:Hydroxysteroid 17-beta dehydrogenase 2 n=1 Tax=Ornithorhynchus anatinus TaxID=9258 RepID=A0A6I8NCW1_ORNAN